MVINCYAGEVKTLTDVEIDRLIKELDAADVHSEGFDCDEWGELARARLMDLETEKRQRWELANPEEAARRRCSPANADIIDAQLNAIRPKLLDMFERSAVVSRLIRGK